MPTKDIEELLLPWYRNSRPNRRSQSRAGVRWIRLSVTSPAIEPKRKTPSTDALLRQFASVSEEKCEAVKDDWVVDETRKASLVTTNEREVMAHCELLKIDGDEAVCSVKVSGYEVPSVSFPARVLRAKGVTVGKRFIWTIRNASVISADDIDPETATSTRPQLSDEMQKQFDKLYEESLQRRKEHGTDWPEYTGPGE